MPDPILLFCKVNSLRYLVVSKYISSLSSSYVVIKNREKLIKYLNLNKFLFYAVIILKSIYMNGKQNDEGKSIAANCTDY